MMFRRRSSCYPYILITLGASVVAILWLPIEWITVLLGLSLICAGIKLICR